MSDCAIFIIEGDPNIGLLMSNNEKNIDIDVEMVIARAQRLSHLASLQEAQGGNCGGENYLKSTVGTDAAGILCEGKLRDTEINIGFRKKIIRNVLV